jgi:eukaryotic-like serine/threonine-protein kinase
VTDEVERWRRAAAIVEQIMEQPMAERRGAIDRACAGDSTLADAVQQWLAAIDSPTPLLDQPLWPVEAISTLARHDPPPALLPDTRIGAWSIVRVIGAGGMGVVYEAARADGAFARRVALKVVRATTTQPWFAKRLEQERQLLARLDHPSIARLIDGGVLPDGTPFYAMELVEGGPIDRWCDQRHLDIPGRLRLFRQVCEAVSYAHRQFVVHRDLKPSNILVASDGQIKIVDFGIAQSLTDPSDERDDARALSPDYASPEQFAGRVTTALSDVYSLTAVLHTLLVGVSPHRRAAPPPSPVRPQPPLVGELEAVVRRGLESDVAKRYPSVDALDADIANVLASRPVSARPATWQRRTWFFMRRNATAVVLTTAVALGLLTTTAVALRQAERAEQSRQRVAAVNGFLLDILSLPYPFDSGTTRQVSMRTLLDSARARSAQLVEAADTSGAALLSALAKGYTGLGDFATAADVARQAVTLAIRTSGGDRGQVVLRYGLAELRLRGGDAAAARAELDTADQFVRAEVGSDSLALAVLLQQKARTLRELGDLSAAERAIREAVGLFEGVAGGVQRSPYANALQTLGHLQLDRAAYVEAEQSYRRALAVRRRLQGGAIELANVQGDIAAAAMAQGKLAMADSLLGTSDALKRSQLPPGDAEIADDEVKRGQLSLYRGAFSRAEQQLIEAQAHYAAIGPIAPWRLAPLLEALAVARLGQRDPVGAARLADAGLDALRTISPNPSLLRAALFAVRSAADEQLGQGSEATRRRNQCRQDVTVLRPGDPTAWRAVCAQRYGRAIAAADGG